MRRLTVKRILELAAEHAAMTVDELTGDQKTNDRVIPRHRAMLVIRTLRPDMSYPEVGRRMGGFDHTSVLHGERRARQRMEASPEEAAAFAELLALCRAEASKLADLLVELRADGVTHASEEDLVRWRRVDRLDRAIWLVGGVLADLQQARELASDTTGDLFAQAAA